MLDQPVSVIIPTYNRAYRITTSIQSVLNQTYSELEVIVVDDGSTDNTEEVVSAIGDSRLKYHRLEENKGAANARNIGVSLAHNDVIAFNDSDESGIRISWKSRLIIGTIVPKVSWFIVPIR